MVDTLALDARSTALVVIDLQQGIVARALSPYDAPQVVSHAARLGQRCNESGATVVLVHVGYAADGADRLKQPVDEPMPVPPGGIPPGWFEFVPEMKALRADVVIMKRQWGAFYGTELDLQLRRRGITTIVLCGIATNFGVESTAREAWQHGYSVVVAEDACTSVADGMHAFAIGRVLPRVSRVRSTSEILSAL